MYIHIHIYICICIYVHAYLFILIYINICIFVYMYFHIYIYSYMYIYIHIIHIYIYVCLCGVDITGGLCTHNTSTALRFPRRLHPRMQRQVRMLISLRWVRMSRLFGETHLSADLQRVTWLVHLCDMTRSCVWWKDSLVGRPATCDMTRSFVWRDSFMCATWLVIYCVRGIVHRLCGESHSCSFVWRDLLICVMSRLTRRQTCNVWRDSFICVTWLVHVCDMTRDLYCDMTRSFVWRGALD